ncbi:hypothetical protein B4U84_12550 [Westiellopsis prolifica IICB1]|nr:hypothetical protein B4U84_12550 [Westiellopsis prolifica IICB1]
MLGCWLTRSIFYFLDTDFPYKEAQSIARVESVVLGAGVFLAQMKCDRRKAGALHHRVVSPLENRFSSCKSNHNDRFFQ